MTEHTPEQLALARKCAAQYWQTGEESDESAARHILSGEWDDQAYVQAALAAIVETTERIETVLDRCGEPCPDCRDAIERGDHLKDQL